jgi:biopolymer transport protein ExbD
MKITLEVCLLVLAMVPVTVSAQEPTKPALRHGVSVMMPVSSQAVEMQSADDLNATLVAVSADGKLFVGAQPAQLNDLGKLDAKTVYVKADARVPYQSVLTVLDALRGHSLVLLAVPSSKSIGTGIPYGVNVSLGSR